MLLLKNIIYAILQGLYDSIKGITIIFHISSQANISGSSKRDDDETKSNHSYKSEKSSKSKPEITRQVFKCCALNGGFAWLSIILFEHGILPFLKYLLTLSYGKNSEQLENIWNLLQSSLSVIFGTVWLLPIFLLSRIVSSLWFQDIANAAYMYRKGRPQLIPSVSKLIADTLFSLLIQALFLVQSIIVSLVPIKYLNTFCYYVHMCMLYALYSFEYKWFNMGWELHKRLNYIENNWPYFIGFGILLTVLTSIPNSYIVSGCVFSIVFPIFILSGNEAQPVTGICNFSLRLFSPVIAISNLFFAKPTKSQQTSAATISKQPSIDKKYSNVLKTR